MLLIAQEVQNHIHLQKLIYIIYNAVDITSVVRFKENGIQIRWLHSV